HGRVVVELRVGPGDIEAAEGLGLVRGCEGRERGEQREGDERTARAGHAPGEFTSDEHRHDALAQLGQEHGQAAALAAGGVVEAEVVETLALALAVARGELVEDRLGVALRVSAESMRVQCWIEAESLALLGEALALVFSARNEA